MYKPLEICTNNLIVAAALNARKAEREYMTLPRLHTMAYAERYVIAKRAADAHRELRVLCDFRLGEPIEPEPRR